MLGNCSCFYCRLLTFFITFFFKSYFRNTIRVSNSLDSDQDRCYVGRTWFKLLAKAISRRQKSPLAGKALDESSVTTLLETTLQIYSLLKCIPVCFDRIQHNKNVCLVQYVCTQGNRTKISGHFSFFFIKRLVVILT